MSPFGRVLGVMRFVGVCALRSRRLLVTAILFAVVGAGMMYANISIFAALEREVVSALALPTTDQVGAVTKTLWESRHFTAAVEHLIGNPLVFADIRGDHPVVLAFACFIFYVVPLLTLIVSAPTAAGEIRSGSVRYVLLRVSRGEWTLGMFLGEAAALLIAMLLMALAADAVATWRLPGWGGLALLPSVCLWSLRAWVYALSWLGVCLCASLVARTPGKATSLAMLLMLVFTILGFVADKYAPWLDFLYPQGCKWLMWRSSPSAMLEGIVALLSVAFLWLGIGSAAFARRDV